jgi:hypothetical protein
MRSDEGDSSSGFEGGADSEIDTKEETCSRKHEWEKLSDETEKQNILQKKDYSLRWVYTERVGAQVFKCIHHHNCEFLVRITCVGKH